MRLRLALRALNKNEERWRLGHPGVRMSTIVRACHVVNRWFNRHPDGLVNGRRRPKTGARWTREDTGDGPGIGGRYPASEE